MLPCLEATYSKSKNAVTSTPSSQNKSLTSVSQARLYPICAKGWKSIQILDERRTIFSICPYRKKIFLNSHSRRIWWKILGKACFNIQNSSFLSSSSLRYADQIQQKKREHILVEQSLHTHVFSTAEPPSTPWSTRTPSFHNTAVTLPVLRKLCHSRIWLLSPHLSHQTRIVSFHQQNRRRLQKCFPLSYTALDMQAGGVSYKSSHSYHCPLSLSLFPGTLWGTFSDRLGTSNTQEPLSHHLKPPQIPGTSC